MGQKVQEWEMKYEKSWILRHILHLKPLIVCMRSLGGHTTETAYNENYISTMDDL